MRPLPEVPQAGSDEEVQGIKVMKRAAAHLFRQLRALAACAAALAALWIAYGYAQNGRYTLRIVPPVLTDRETGQATDERLLVLDTRTGDIFERHGRYRTATRVSGETEARWVWFVNHLTQGHPAPTPKSFIPDPRK